MHPLINPEEFFTPSKLAKERWRRTRKKVAKVGEGEENVKLYGLFSTYNYIGDLRGFWAAISLELLGVAAIIWAAGSFNLYIFFGFIAGIGLDVTFAILAHFKVGTICQLRNERTINLYYEKRISEVALLNNNESLSGGGNRAKGYKELAKNKSNEILGWSIFHGFFKLLIVLIALVKIFVFQQLQDSISTVTFGVIILYLWIAYLQITHTGFYLSESFFRKTIEKELAAFNIKLATKKEATKLLDQKDISIFVPRPTEHEELVGNIIIKTDMPSHKNCIERIGGKLNYKTWGVLQDSDLLTIATNQTDMEATKFVATMGLEMQLRMLNEESTNDDILKKLG